jgi:hypothetical protein
VGVAEDLNRLKVDCCTSKRYQKMADAIIQIQDDEQLKNEMGEKEEIGREKYMEGLPQYGKIIKNILSKP